MDELKKGLDIAMKGAAARAALSSFKKQSLGWGVALPKVKPLVLDFGLGQFESIGLIEYWIANEARHGYCGKYLFVSGGQTCPEHAHRTKHETFFVVKGEVLMRAGGKTRILKEGAVLPVLAGKRHSFTGKGPALLLELSMPCAISDNLFTNPRIPIGEGRTAHRSKPRLNSPGGTPKKRRNKRERAA